MGQRFYEHSKSWIQALSKWIRRGRTRRIFRLWCCMCSMYLEGLAYQDTVLKNKTNIITLAACVPASEQIVIVSRFVNRARFHSTTWRNSFSFGLTNKTFLRTIVRTISKRCKRASRAKASWRVKSNELNAWPETSEREIPSATVWTYSVNTIGWTINYGVNSPMKRLLRRYISGRSQERNNGETLTWDR